MGSFNTTCFVSQQTISTDDEVVVIPISQQTSYSPVELISNGKSGDKKYSKYGHTSSTCNSTAFWSYEGPLLKGKYDDYGRVTFDDTPENKEYINLFLTNLSSKVFNVIEGENKSHDIPLIFSDIYNPKNNYSFEELISIMDKVWEVSNESRLFVKNYLGEPVNLSFSIMHKATADYLIDSVNNKTNWAGDSLEMTSYFHTYLNKKLKRHIDIFSDKKEFSDIINFYSFQIPSLQEYSIGSDEGTHISNLYGYLDKSIDTVVNYFKEHTDKREIPLELSDLLFQYFKPQIEHRYIDQGLNDLNIKLSPMVYADQDYDNSLGNSYLAMVKSVNKTINNNIKARYGDEEEEISIVRPKM